MSNNNEKNLSIEELTKISQYLNTLKLLFEKYVFTNIFNNVETENLVYQTHIKNIIVDSYSNEIYTNLEINLEFLEVNEFCDLLLNDFVNLKLNDDEKYHYLSSYIKYIFDLDSNNSFVTNPKIDDFTYENLSQIANIIIFAIYKEIIDPILGSILIAEVWPLVSYDSRLNKFIGREMEINELKNKINESTNSIEILDLEDKIAQEKRKLIFESQMFIITLTK